MHCDKWLCLFAEHQNTNIHYAALYYLQFCNADLELDVVVDDNVDEKG